MVMSNPSIPQQTKDEMFAFTLEQINTNLKEQEVKTIAPVTVVEPVAFSAPIEPVFIESVATSTATSTATTTQYVAGSVRTEGGKVIFNKGDSDLFRTKFTLTKGDGIEEGKPHHNISDLRANPNTPQEQEDDWSTQEIEGTLWIFSSRKGQVLSEKTYNFKVENGVATLY